MHDPISDMLTRVRNGQQAKHMRVTMNSSKLKEEIASVLKNEGYILDFYVETLEKNKKQLTIVLKYFKGKAVIESIKRISRPGNRVYLPSKALKAVAGFGITIMSTSKGVMTHVAAKSNCVGGEVLCEVA